MEQKFADVLFMWFQKNLDLIYFVYGLAFLAMGVSVLMQRARQARGSIFRLADVMWLLAWFGIMHGLAQFLQMWFIIKGENQTLSRVGWFISIASYIFLFEFGRQLIRQGELKCADWRARIAGCFKWWMAPAFGVIILILGLLSINFWDIAGIWSRYFYGFIGGLMTGVGFSFYYSCEKGLLESLNVRKYFIWSTISFIAVGILGGLIVEKRDIFFLPNTINADWFANTVKIPVQALLAVCGMVGAVAIGGILNVFNWERTKQLHLELEREKELARMDALTGIANIRSFNEIASYEINRSKRYKHPISIAYIDLDNFKNINDTFGHSTGNTLLSIVANIIYNNIRITDMVSRMGGDEFAILLTETGPEQAKVVIYKVQKLLYESMQKNGWPVTFSIGVVTYIVPPNLVEELIKSADDMMYYAKHSGKNTIKFEIYGQK